MSRDAEALLDLLPAYERRRGPDGEPSLLELLIRAIGVQTELVDRDIDRLYDDLFIETCEDWVAPYIGALVGYVPLSGPSAAFRSPRADVAATVGLRRAKGTATAIDRLTRTVTGWPARIREAALEIARTEHLNFQAPQRFGTASLRAPLPAMLPTAQFLRVPRTVDLRGGRRGGWNLPNVLIDIFSDMAVPLIDADPCRVEPQRYTFDPLGRDIGLVHPGRPTADDRVDTLDDVCLPVSVRRLHDDLTGDAAMLAGQRPLFRILIDGQPIPAHAVEASDLGVWRGPSGAGIRAAVDPARGRFALDADPGAARVSVDWWHAAATTVDRAALPLGAGGWSRLDEPVAGEPATDVPRGADIAALVAAGTESDLRLTASAVYADDLTLVVPAGAKLRIRAASGVRAVVGGRLAIDLGAGAALSIEGLLVGGGVAVSGSGSLDLALSTLLPPDDGIALRWLDGSGSLRVERCHSGSLALGPIIDLDATDTLVAGDIGGEAGAAGGRLSLERSTVSGNIRMREIGSVSNAIVAGALVVDRLQAGCVRYSALGAGSIAPGGYRRQPDTVAGEAVAAARSRDPAIAQAALDAVDAETRAVNRPLFGELWPEGPAAARLDPRSGPAILFGGENGNETGVWSSLGTPFRMANLVERLDDFIRIGFTAHVREKGAGGLLP